MNPAGREWQGEIGMARPHMIDMRAWTASAIRSYYLDPEIVFLDAGHREPGGVRLTQSGYYVAPHCDPELPSIWRNIQIEFWAISHA